MWNSDHLLGHSPAFSELSAVVASARLQKQESQVSQNEEEAMGFVQCTSSSFTSDEATKNHVLCDIVEANATSGTEEYSERGSYDESPEEYDESPKEYSERGSYDESFLKVQFSSHVLLDMPPENCSEQPRTTYTGQSGTINHSNLVRGILHRDGPSLEEAALAKPKRRNVKISKDPQTVAARHRRERISQKIRILRRMVPGSTRMDTASMLDEAIHYVKFLQTQVQSMETLHNLVFGA